MKLKRHIVAIDDNAGVRTALEILLAQRFATVITLPHPDKLRQSVAGNGIPDAILLDMNYRSRTNDGNPPSRLLLCFPSLKCRWC